MCDQAGVTTSSDARAVSVCARQPITYSSTRTRQAKQPRQHDDRPEPPDEASPGDGDEAEYVRLYTLNSVSEIRPSFLLGSNGPGNCLGDPCWQLMRTECQDLYNLCLIRHRTDARSERRQRARCYSEGRLRSATRSVPQLGRAGCGLRRYVPH